MYLGTLTKLVACLVIPAKAGIQVFDTVVLLEPLSEKTELRYSMNTLTIGNVARLTGIGVETIRFYEREGLINKPPRRKSGYRDYPVETVSRIRFIKRAKELGFALKEIKEILSLRIDPETTCNDIQKRAVTKIKDIDERIQSLLSIKNALMNLSENCKVNEPISECPILDFLESENSHDGEK